MKIATSNVNCVNDRRSLLLPWLEEAALDVFCLLAIVVRRSSHSAAPAHTANLIPVWGFDEAMKSSRACSGSAC